MHIWLFYDLNNRETTVKSRESNKMTEIFKDRQDLKKITAAIPTQYLIYEWDNT